jgi:AcrR family transcriptional regulator
MAVSSKSKPLLRPIKNHRLKNEQLDRAGALMEVALDLFAKRDFASVTIKDIARELGVNTALIYYYFNDKEDLFRATIDRAITNALENYGRLRGKHHDPVLLIEDWFNTNVQLSAEIRKLVKIMIDYCGSRSRLGSIDRLIEQFYREEIRILAGSIREGIARGIFEPVNARRLALFVSAHLDGIMVASITRPHFNMRAAMNDLKYQLWESLGYSKEGKSVPHA